MRNTTISKERERKLFEAVYSNNLEEALGLLNSRVNANCRNQRGWTPAHEAVSGGNNIMLMVLFEYGADPDSSTKAVHSLYHYASLGGLRGTEQIILGKQLYEKSDYYRRIILEARYELRKSGKLKELEILDKAVKRNMKSYLRS